MVRRFETPAALFGPADVIPESPVVVTPPPTTIPPGPCPVTNERFCENVVYGDESKLKPARENPAVKLFSMLGERRCVSCMLATWLRSAAAEANSGSAVGIKLVPSSSVYAADRVSRSRRI